LNVEEKGEKRKREKRGKGRSEKQEKEYEVNKTSGTTWYHTWCW